MVIPDETLIWFLEGDLAIQYQVHRDLQGEDRPDHIGALITTEGLDTLFPG